jgi:hypothetical protein
MPHIDELFACTTVAAAGLFAVIALQPIVSGAPGSAGVRTESQIATAATPPGAGPMVRLPPVEVVARRSVELARIESEAKLARERLAKDVARPET